jgi:mRNA interferase MazF
VRRGEVWWADFGPPRGSAPTKLRPTLVISANRFNRSSISTVMVAVLTSNVRYADLPGNVLIPAGMAGLDRDSVVNVSQVATLDREDLDRCAGRLEGELLADVDRGLRLALSL